MNKRNAPASAASVRRGRDAFKGMTTRTDKLGAAHAEMVAAVESLTTGDDWRRMLDVASRFHRYSAGNVFLIMLQAPDATRVAGYRTWQALGRQVRKGERGIRILAPCVYRRNEADPATGEESSRVVLRGFTTASVFDVAQTDGEPLPDVRPSLLEGDCVAGLWDSLAAQVAAQGYVLERGDCGGANGRTDPSIRTVRVREDVSEAQAAKTLAHELAHIMLAHTDSLWSYATCRGRCEVEAESVAFLVCRAAGMPTDAYAFPYVARWADGNVAVVQETADRVIGAARAILAAITADESACGAELAEVA